MEDATVKSSLAIIQVSLEEGKPLVGFVLAWSLGLSLLSFLFSAIVQVEPELIFSTHTAADGALILGGLWVGAAAGCGGHDEATFWLSRPIGRLTLVGTRVLALLGPLLLSSLMGNLASAALGLGTVLPSTFMLMVTGYAILAGLAGGVFIPQRASALALGAIFFVLMPWGGLLAAVGGSVGFDRLSKSPHYLDALTVATALSWCALLAVVVVYWRTSAPSHARRIILSPTVTLLGSSLVAYSVLKVLLITAWSTF